MWYMVLDKIVQKPYQFTTNRPYNRLLNYIQTVIYHLRETAVISALIHRMVNFQLVLYY